MGQKKVIDEENRRVDCETALSLATSTHVWGAEPTNVAREREVFDNQVTAMELRKREDKARYAAETRAEQELIRVEQGRLVDMWRLKKEREHAKTVQFAASLETAIERRQREESDKRESEKRSEREH